MRTIVVSAVIVSFSVAAMSGCMMMGMCGGMMGSNQSQEAAEKEPIVKEMTYGDYRIVAEFSALEQHKKSLLSLRVRSLSEGRRLDSLRLLTENDAPAVSSTVRIIITLGQKNDGEENVLLEELLTQSGNGAYEFSFTPQEKGTYRIAFLIEKVGDTQLEKPLILSAAQEV